MNNAPAPAPQKRHTINPDFANLLIDWQQRHGRHHLPWQRDRDPYKVWLSEVMLQQTQVVTVIDYFHRFLVRFPNVFELAKAPLHEVLGLWSGLGYYSRARNLHQCAHIVATQWDGLFPKTVHELQQLPGIGRSTAAAIAAICFGQRVSILDGNAKRVIARYLGFRDNLALPANEKALWSLAETLLPEPTPQVTNPMPVYTQGLMDLGALLCTANAPACGDCPVGSTCRASALQLQAVLPMKKKSLTRTHASYWLLCARSGVMGSESKILWQRRPLTGIWAGLLCLPVFETQEQLLAATPSELITTALFSAPVKHALTHKQLTLHFVEIDIPGGVTDHMALAVNGQWLCSDQWRNQGLPAPVRRWLTSHPIHGGV